MNLIGTNRLPWLLSGALGASLVLAPALVAQQQQSGATAQQTPTPGQQGDWGPAGPPPDAQNGQIPAPDNTAQDPNQGADQGPPQYPGQAPSAPPASPGVGYGQPPRPAYQPGQNQSNGYNGYQAPQTSTQAPPAPPSGPVTLTKGMLLAIRTSEPLDSKKVKPGEYFQGTVAQSVYRRQRTGDSPWRPGHRADRGCQETGRVEGWRKYRAPTDQLESGWQFLRSGNRYYLTPAAQARVVTPPPTRLAPPHSVQPSEPLPVVAQALPSERSPAPVLG